MSIAPQFDPAFVLGTSALDPTAAPESHDAKSPPLDALYAERKQYLTVPQDRYFDAAFAEREWKGMWTKVWTCAGLVSDLKESGDWLKYDLGVESFIVVKGADGVIRAFYNVCQHRGRQLVTDDFGSLASFVCPYHSWAYGLDGKNLRVTDRQFFQNGALCGDLGLREVRCELWAGFVFINMDLDAVPLMEFLDQVPSLMSAYQMEKMHIVKDVTLPLNCNWRITLEAFIEHYHLHSTHPQSLAFVDDVYAQLDFYKNGHGRINTPFGLPSPRHPDQQGLNVWLRYMLNDAGIDPDTFEGTAQDVRPAIWKAKRQPNNAFGLDYSLFSDTQLTDDWNYSVFPNMTFNPHPEGVLIMRILPHADDPKKSYYHVWILVPKLQEGKRPPAYFGIEDDVDISGATRPKRRYTTVENSEVGMVLEQDVSNILAVQRGTRSAGFSSGTRFCETEQRLQQVYAEIDRYLRRAGI